MSQGTVTWIGLRPDRVTPMTVVASAEVVEGVGLVGDRAKRKGGKRQVTFILAEHLPVLEALTGQSIDPAILRRNVVVSGLNLTALLGKEFEVGGVRFLATQHCDPCEKMEAALGPGGRDAMEFHGGITAKALTSGTISVGDAVVPAQ